MPQFGTVHTMDWKNNGEWHTYKVLLNKDRFMAHIKEHGLEWILRAAEKEREKGDDGVQDKIAPKRR